MRAMVRAIAWRSSSMQRTQRNCRRGNGELKQNWGKCLNNHQDILPWKLSSKWIVLHTLLAYFLQGISQQSHDFQVRRLIKTHNQYQTCQIFNYCFESHFILSVTCTLVLKWEDVTMPVRAEELMKYWWCMWDLRSIIKEHFQLSASTVPLCSPRSSKSCSKAC